MSARLVKLILRKNQVRRVRGMERVLRPRFRRVNELLRYVRRRGLVLYTYLTVKYLTFMLGN